MLAASALPLVLPPAGASLASSFLSFSCFFPSLSSELSYSTASARILRARGDVASIAVMMHTMILYAALFFIFIMLIRLSQGISFSP